MTGSVGKLKFGFNVVSFCGESLGWPDSPGSHKSRFPQTLQYGRTRRFCQWQDFALLVTTSSHAPFNFGQTLQFYLSIHWTARVYEQMGEAGFEEQEHCAKKL